MSLHMESNTYLRQLSVVSSQLRVTGIKGAEFIAKGIAVSASLTSIDLSDNRLGPEGGKCVAEGIAVSASLTSINLEENELGEEGAKHIAEGIAVSASLRKVLAF